MIEGIIEHRLKPFYILSPSLRETETCGCIKCMNPYSIYNTIRKNDKNNDYLVSLTEFLTKGVSRERDPQIDYCHIKCINNLCENKCS